MMIFILWWLSVGFVVATMVYYVDCLEASCVDSPWMIILGAVLWPILYVPAFLGMVSMYKYRKSEGDIL